jgi:exonuclease SbcC
MIPIKLNISGFLSYRDPVEIDFTRFDVAAISGQNGAGKSSLLDAITFALFGEARNRGEALINTHPGVQAAEVVLSFEYEGNVYRVQRVQPRDKGTLLEFQIRNPEGKWKPLTERTVRDTEQRIRETLRLDYDTFVNASFFLQGKADQFTQQKPSDRKRILGNILGLEIWEQYRLGAAERRKRVETEVETLQGRLHEISAELGEEEQRKQRLADLDRQLKEFAGKRNTQEKAVDQLRLQAAAVDQQAKLVATLEAAVQRADAQLASQRSRLAERKQEQATSADLMARAKEIEKAHAEWQRLRGELANWDAVATQFNKQEKQRTAPLTAIEAERARLQTELQALQAEAGKAATSAATRAELDKNYKVLIAQVKTLEVKTTKLPELETELKSAQAVQTKAVSENALLFTEMKVLDERRTLVRNATGAYCPTCGQALTEEHRTKTIESLTDEGKRMGDLWRANKKGLEAKEKELARLEKNYQNAREADEELRGKVRLADQAKSSLEELEKLGAVWENEKAPRMQVVQTALESENFAPEARQKLAQIDEELKKIGYDAAAHDQVRKAEQESRTSEDQLRALESAKGAAKPLEREIKELEKQIAAQEEEASGQRTAFELAQAGLQAARGGLPDLQSAERELLGLQEQENQLRLELGQAKQQVAVLDVQRERKKELEAQRDTIAARVAQYQALERAFGKDGVPAMLIEQALPQIESKANEILDRLSNGDMSINFVTQQAFKDKKREDLRETLEIQIRDGSGQRDYEMFSGGEAFRINFAIRLALSEVLAQRAGARLQTLVIDEGFASQDEIGRQRLVEVINTVRSDFAKILVITHVESLKDAFPSRIEVEKGSRGSQLRVI